MFAVAGKRELFKLPAVTRRIQNRDSVSLERNAIPFRRVCTKSEGRNDLGTNAEHDYLTELAKLFEAKHGPINWARMVPPKPGKKGELREESWFGDLFPPDRDIARICNHPFVSLVCGHRNGGKTALAVRIQELLRHEADPYAVGLPDEALKLLPDWYGVVQSVEELPANCVAYIPEAYRTFHARGRGISQAQLVSNLVNLSRHRNQSLIFEVQNATQLDRNIISEADLLLIKEPSPLGEGFERPQLRQYIDEARGLFSVMNKSHRKRATYIVAPTEGVHGKIMENRLPSFWSKKLSTIFGATRPSTGTALATRRPQGRRTTTAVGERRTKAKSMHQEGFTYGEIANALGVSKSQAYRYCN